MKSFYLSAVKIKSVFGILLGVGGLIYGSVLYLNDTGSLKALLVYGILGLIFFISGVKLIRNLD